LVPTRSCARARPRTNRSPDVGWGAPGAEVAGRGPSFGALTGTARSTGSGASHHAVKWPVRNPEALPCVFHHEMGIVGQEPGRGSRSEQGERQRAHRGQGASAGRTAPTPNPQEHEALSADGPGGRQSAEGLVLTPWAVRPLGAVDVAPAFASSPGGSTAATVQRATEGQEGHAGGDGQRQKDAQRGPPPHAGTISPPPIRSWRRRLRLCILGNWAKGTFRLPSRSLIGVTPEGS